MLLKGYKSSVWNLLLMLMPFISYAPPPGWNPVLNLKSAVYAIQKDVTLNEPLEALAAGDYVEAFFDDDGTLVSAGMVEWTGTENVAVVAFSKDTIGDETTGYTGDEVTDVLVEASATQDFALQPECTDAEILNWPATPDNICKDMGLSIDFSGVSHLPEDKKDSYDIDPKDAGNWGGGGYDDKEFILDPDFVGKVTITYTVDGTEPCYGAVEIMEFEVYDLPEVRLEAFDPVCEGTDAFDLNGGTPEGGTYFVDGEKATSFDPAEAGEYGVEYYSDANGCTNSAKAMILVNEVPEVICPVYEPIIAISDDFPKDIELAGATPEDGVYSGDGVGDGVLTAHDYGNYDITYTYTSPNGCTNFCVFTIIVSGCLDAEILNWPTTPDNICTGVGLSIDFTAVEILNAESFEYIVTEGAGYWGNGVFFLNPDFVGMVNIQMNAHYATEPCNDAMEMIEFEVYPLTEITLQPASAEVLYGGPAVFTVEADNATGYQWFGPAGKIVGAKDGTFTIEGVVRADAGDYYVVVGGECKEVTSSTALLSVQPWEQCIDLLGAVNGASTYLDLLDDNVATVFAPLSLNAVEFYAPGMVYLPGGATFPWNEAQGAKVSLLKDGYSDQLCVAGYPTLGSVVDVPAGWSLLPVWSPDVVLAADVFEPFGDNLIAVFSIDYSGIYWPVYNIYTLETLVPGSAYLIALGVPGQADFDVPPIDGMTPSFVAHPANPTAWNDVTMTGTQHNIAITKTALEGLQVGDVICAFNQYGANAGMVEVTSLKQNIAIRVYGDNFATQETEGFIDGDVMTFKVYRDGEIIEVVATFDANLPNTNVFENEGMSAITAFKAGVTSINDLTFGLSANLYPNPATQFLNIETNFEFRNLKVVNFVGQVVFDRKTDHMTYQINTSNFGSGMYFVQIESADGTVITKRLTVN